MLNQEHSLPNLINYDAESKYHDQYQYSCLTNINTRPIKTNTVPNIHKTATSPSLPLCFINSSLLLCYVVWTTSILLNGVNYFVGVKRD